MDSWLWLMGGIAIALGIIVTYVVAIRALQESRKSINYLNRQQSKVRATRAFYGLGALIVAGIAVLIAGISGGVTLPEIPAFEIASPQPTSTVTETLAPLNTPTQAATSFVITATPVASPTATVTLEPAVPLVVEALFEGLVTPNPGVQIERIQFSTQIDNGRPVVAASSFGNPIKQMYVFFTYNNIEPGVQWTALWYRDGELQFFDTKVWDQPVSGIGSAVWQQSADKWLPGEYEVRIFVGTEWKASGRFQLTGDAPTVTNTPSITPTSTPSNTATATPRPSNTSTKTPLPTATVPASNTPSSTVTSTSIPSNTPSKTATTTPSNTPSKIPSATPTSSTPRSLSAASSTSTPRPSSTATKVPSATTIPSATPSRVFTATIAHTPTSSVTNPPSQTASITSTRAVTLTPSRTPSSTPSRTPSRVPSNTPTFTPSNTSTSIPSATSSRTPSFTPTTTSTRTPFPSSTSTPLVINVNIVFPDKNLLERGTPPYEKAVTREILSSVNPIGAVVDEYFKGPNALEQSSGLVAIWNGFTGYDRIELKNGILRIYLKGICLGNRSDYTIVQPLTATVKQFDYVQFVKIYDENGSTRNLFDAVDSAPVCLDPSFTPSPTITFTPTRTPTFTPSNTPTKTFTPSVTPTFTSTSTFTHTPTWTPSNTSTVTPSQTPSLTPSKTPSITPSFTPSNTATFTPSKTQTNTPTLTPSRTPSFTPSNTLTITPSFTPSNTATVTPLNTATATPSNTPTRTPSFTPTLTPSRTPSFTPSNTPTITPSLTPSNTATFTPSNTPTITPSNTPTRTPSNTPTLTPSRTPSFTPSKTPTITPSLTPSNTATFTPSNTPTITPSNTPTRTPSNTPTLTPSRTPSFTPSKTPTITPSFTPSNTATFTPSNTPTITPSNTPTRTPSFTPTITPSRTPSFTPTNTATRTPSNTPTFTITPSNTATFTATSTSTITPTPTLDPECNRASFVSDVTVPDGTIITATEKFTKTWRFENTGTCTWSTDYKLVFIGGDRMGSPDGISLSNPVLPNEEIEISIDLTAPELPGIYKGVWILEDGAGNRFGLGSQSRGEIWVQVQVIAGPTATFTTEPTQTALPSQTAVPSQTPLPTATPLLGINESETFAYDLVKEACSAQWSSNGQGQPCPASGGEAQNNSVGLTSNAILENGAVISEPSIIVIPGVANSFVTAAYPAYTVQPGDHFRAIVGCESAASTCAVLFRISYQNELGITNDLWAVGEFYDQNITTVDIDLSPLAGQNIKLILDTKSLNSSATDRTLWVSPGIYREAPATPTATFTAEPSVAPTNTAAPSPTATAVPSTPTTQPTILDQILEFLRSLFGG